MNKQQISKDQKTVLAGVVVLAVATVAGLAVVATVASRQTQLGPATQASVVNLRGKTVCLQKDSGAGPQPAACVYGLKVSDDISYALAGIETKNGKPLRTGDLVTVTGTLTPPPEDSAYETAGRIAVDEMTLQQSVSRQ